MLNYKYALDDYANNNPTASGLVGYDREQSSTTSVAQNINRFITDTLVRLGTNAPLLADVQADTTNILSKYYGELIKQEHRLAIATGLSINGYSEVFSGTNTAAQVVTADLSPYEFGSLPENTWWYFYGLHDNPYSSPQVRKFTSGYRIILGSETAPTEENISGVLFLDSGKSEEDQIKKNVAAISLLHEWLSCDSDQEILEQQINLKETKVNLDVNRTASRKLFP